MQRMKNKASDENIAIATEVAALQVSHFNILVAKGLSRIEATELSKFFAFAAMDLVCGKDETSEKP